MLFSGYRLYRLIPTFAESRLFPRLLTGQHGGLFVIEFCQGSGVFGTALLALYDAADGECDDDEHEKCGDADADADFGFGAQGAPFFCQGFVGSEEFVFDG